jgi:2-oxoglutarate ferredoxin oxidoreductase subunit beta
LNLLIVEILLNCVIFNDGIHDNILAREYRSDKTIFLRHGEKMIFGKDNNKGIVQSGFDLKAVTIGEDGYTLDDILIHDTTTPDPALHLKLALMEGNKLPVALGLIRNVEAAAYDEDMEKQIENVRAKKPARTLKEFLMTGDVWEVK